MSDFNFKDGDFITDGIAWYIFKKVGKDEEANDVVYFHAIVRRGDDTTWFNQIRKEDLREFMYLNETAVKEMLSYLELIGKYFDEVNKVIVNVNFKPEIGEEYFYPDIYSAVREYGSCKYNNHLENSMAVQHGLAFKYKEGAIRKREEIHRYNSSRRDL